MKNKQFDDLISELKEKMFLKLRLYEVILNNDKECLILREHEKRNLIKEVIDTIAKKYYSQKKLVKMPQETKDGESHFDTLRGDFIRELKEKEIVCEIFDDDSSNSHNEMCVKVKDIDKIAKKYKKRIIK